MIDKMVIIDPKTTRVFECGPFGIYPKGEGVSVLDTRDMQGGFHEYHYIPRKATFAQKLKLLFCGNS